MMHCEVYAIIVDGVIRYIGKGNRRRRFDHARIARNLAARRAAGERIAASPFYNRLAKALLGGSAVTSLIITDGLSEKGAYERERQEIALRAASLWNLRAGGRGSTAEEQLRLWRERPEMVQKRRQASKALWQDPAYRERQRTAHKASMASSDYRKKHREAVRKAAQTPAFIERARSRKNSDWADPSYRARIGDALRAAGKRPETRSNKSAAAKAAWGRPGFRQRMRKKHLALWRDDDRRAKASAKQSAAMKARWRDPEQRKFLLDAIRRRSPISEETRRRMSESQRRRRDR
jgi:hypothetical protein